MHIVDGLLVSVLFVSTDDLSNKLDWLNEVKE